MAATTATRGLTAPDLDSIRSTLASGRKPKVVFTEAAGQIVGQIGQVVDLIDPPVDEWIVVRFGRDELPFSPAELAIPAKAPREPKPKPAHEPAAKSATEPAPGPAPGPAPASESERAYPPIAYEQPVTAPPARVPAPRQEVPPMTSTVDSTVPAVKKAAPRTPKMKPPATLTVTLSYTDGDWMVGAQQGTKALAKPYIIKAAEALRMVALLDVPGVHEAVEQIVAAERAETQAHAERLRAELAEIEARLADLPASSR